MSLQLESAWTQEFSKQPFVAGARTVWVTAPHRHGLFRESDVFRIKSKGGSTVRLWDVHGRKIYEGKPKSLRLPVGHYFLENETDRTQFAVLPNNYAGASFLGIESDFGEDPLLTEKIAFIDPSWMRVMGGGCYWGQAEPERDVWDWRKADRTIAASGGPERQAYHWGIHPTGMANR